VSRISKKCRKQGYSNFNPTLLEATRRILDSISRRHSRAPTPFPRYDILTIPVSPVVRTNPVTGWKGLYGMAYGILNGGFDNLAKHESDVIKQYCRFSPFFHNLLYRLLIILSW
jgi:hypothetical protein